MDTTPFIINYSEGGIIKSAEIRPCCNEDNVVDYAVWSNGRLAFTVTINEDDNNWVIALKNADQLIADEVIQEIGQAIEKKYANH